MEATVQLDEEAFVRKAILLESVLQIEHDCVCNAVLDVSLPNVVHVVTLHRQIKNQAAVLTAACSGWSFNNVIMFFVMTSRTH